MPIRLGIKQICGLAAVLTVGVLLLPVSASAAGPPQIEAAWVEGVTPTSALLRAKINPDGAATHFRFEYLTEAAWQANGETFAGAASVPSGEGSLGSGNAPVSAFANLGSLAPTTAYRYRPVATNSAAPGGVVGPEHVLITEQPTNVYPPIDARGYELVSPPDKDGGAVGAPQSLFGGGDFQAAAGGGSFAFSSTSSFGEAPGAPPVSQYLSTRGEAGWSTQNLSAPLEAGGYGDQPDGAPFRLFSSDLTQALTLNGALCAAEGTCPPSYSLWEAGDFSSLPTLAGLRLAGATPDLAHAVFAAEGGLYEWSGGPLEALGGPGTVLAAPIGAISAGGARIYAYQLEDGPIWLLEAGRPARALPETIGGAAQFQAASTDGTFAFYTAGATLHRYDASTETTPSLATGVSGVLGISAAGDTVYYEDGSGLQQWRQGTTTTIVPGAGVAAPSDHPPATATARVSADGEHLAFLSAAQIPPFDNIDANTGQPDTELYLYGPPPAGGAPRLICASCNPTGERPRGSASIPGARANGSSTALYRARVLNAGGNRVFFDSADRLVAPDTDSRPDVYEWEAAGVGDCTRQPGCLGLISGGRAEGGRFLDASESGADAFFLTGESLLPSDPGSIDVYDARIEGGFPEPLQPIPCKGDACQALPSPPEDPSPGTAVPTSGNPPVKYYREHQKKHHHHRKKHREHHRHHHRGDR